MMTLNDPDEMIRRADEQERRRVADRARQGWARDDEGPPRARLDDHVAGQDRRLDRIEGRLDGIASQISGVVPATRDIVNGRFKSIEEKFALEFKERAERTEREFKDRDERLRRELDERDARATKERDEREEYRKDLERWREGIDTQKGQFSTWQRIFYSFLLLTIATFCGMVWAFATGEAQRIIKQTIVEMIDKEAIIQKFVVPVRPNTPMPPAPNQYPPKENAR